MFDIWHDKDLNLAYWVKGNTSLSREKTKFNILLQPQHRNFALVPTLIKNILYLDKPDIIITHGPPMGILDYNNKNTVVIGGIKRRLPFVKSYSFVKKGQYLVTINSSNMIEIGINQGIAAKKLGVKSDDEIKILFD